MQCSPVQLKDKLLKALDKEQNVVDLPSVLEVITALEAYSISKEALEQTRIGKFVNDMRRKTKNKDLARRAKNLVRKWKELIESQQTTQLVNGNEVTGNGTVWKGTPSGVDHLRGLTGIKPESPTSRPGTPSSGRSVVSPGLTGKLSTNSSRPETPLNHLSRASSPRLSRPTTPSIVEHANSVGAASPTMPILSQHKNTAPPEILRANAANKRKRRDEDLGNEMLAKKPRHGVSDNCSDIYDKNVVLRNKLHNSNSELIMNGAIPNLISHSVDHDSSNVNSQFKNNANCDKSKINSLIDQQSRVAQSNKQCIQQRNSPELLLKKNASVPGHLQDLDSQDRTFCKTPKVKTTAELIKEMSENRGLRVAGSQTATKIVLNQITKEKDDINSPVVPPEAKPRFRRKPGTPILPTPRQSLSQTKNDLINKFLQSQSSDPSNSNEDIVPFLFRDESEDMDLYRSGDNEIEIDSRSDLGKRNKVTFFVGDEEAKPAEQVNNSADKCNKEVDPWSLLPPLNLAEIDWTTDEDQKQEGPSQNYDLNELEQEHITGLNGQLDHNNDWCDWTQTHSMPSFDGNLIHILPYVNIDF